MADLNLPKDESIRVDVTFLDDEFFKYNGDFWFGNREAWRLQIGSWIRIQIDKGFITFCIHDSRYFIDEGSVKIKVSLNQKKH